MKHKCPNCSCEYEGKFCPNCGTPWQEEKTCPSCGAKLNGSARFCNKCGFSFYKAAEQVQEGKPKTGFKEKLRAAGAWVKSHLKIVIPTAVALVLVLILSIAIPVGIVNRSNGTYYCLIDDELDKKTYFILKSGSWEDEDGETGTYKRDGEKITFYIEIFGENVKIATGTLKDKILVVDDMKYVSEKHRHSYGEWKTIQAATCVSDGLKSHSCACGVKETQIIKLDHTFGDWYYDTASHWKVCIAGCNQKFHSENHSGKESCTACGYHYGDTIGLSFSLNGDKKSYAVSGIGSAQENEIVIPASYTGLPVTSIGENAFKDCIGLTSFTIPDSVTSISETAFQGCSGLTGITVADGNMIYHSQNNCLIETKSKNLILGCKNSIIPTDGSVMSIGYAAFFSCNGLTSITIPDNVTSIGISAFYGCKSLTRITVPDSVINIGTNAFVNTAFYKSESSWESGVLYIGKHFIEARIAISGSCSMREGTLTIAAAAFYDCSGLTSIAIPDSVTSIGTYAFSNCSGLTEINYSGTMEAWNRIVKDDDWNYKTGNYTVHCTDGDLKK